MPLQPRTALRARRRPPSRSVPQPPAPRQSGSFARRRRRRCRVHLIRPLDRETDAKRSASVPPQKSSRRVPTCRAPSAVEVGLGVLRREALESAAQERVCGLSRGKPGSCFAAARDTERLVTLAARPRRLEDALGPSSVTLSPPQGRPQLLTQRWDSLPTLRPPRRAKRARRNRVLQRYARAGEVRHLGACREPPNADCQWPVEEAWTIRPPLSMFTLRRARRRATEATAVSCICSDPAGGGTGVEG